MAQELAWASYALLRNTNSSGLLVARGDRVLAVRGSVGATHQAPTSLGNVSEASAGAPGALAAVRLRRQCAHQPRVTLMQALSAARALGGPLAQVMSGAQPSVYLPDAAALGGAGAREWAFLPAEAQTLLVQGMQGVVPSGSNSSDVGQLESGKKGSVDEKEVLLLWSDMPRALSQRERLWASAVAAKLHGVLRAE